MMLVVARWPVAKPCVAELHAVFVFLGQERCSERRLTLKRRVKRASRTVLSYCLFLRKRWRLALLLALVLVCCNMDAVALS